MRREEKRERESSRVRRPWNKKEGVLDSRAFYGLFIFRSLLLSLSIKITKLVVSTKLLAC